MNKILGFIVCITLGSYSILAENGYDLWLRYHEIEDEQLRSEYQEVLQTIVLAGNGETITAIHNELNRAIPSMLSSTPKFFKKVPDQGSLIVGTLDELKKLGIDPGIESSDELGRDGFKISTKEGSNKQIIVCGKTPISVLYGTFHFIRLLQTNKAIDNLNIISFPTTKRRMLNHWDKLDGHVERGYAGRSIWKWQELPEKIDPRYSDYARACASVGINGVSVNNVNADVAVLSTEYIKKWAMLAKVFRQYGIKIYISVKWNSPMKLDGLENADPRNRKVQNWWKEKVNEIYAEVPDFGGFLVKANSEGQPGPLTYRATHAEGANMLGEALAPHNGIAMWRAFVYDINIGVDRVNCAYNEFVPLDGKFLPNVSVQVKNGPIDFQPREPFSPLFGVMPKTSLALELQITQEYLGHSKHWVYLGPMWSEVLKSDTYAKSKNATVGDRISGNLFKSNLSIMAGVANTGDSRNWCGHHGAQVNWYSYGRLAWDHSLSTDVIADEWVRATWSNDPEVVATIKEIILPSWETAINYMTPLGLHHMVNGGHHYGPNPGANTASRPFWRNTYYHRADNKGLGVNRSSTGANSTSQYHEPLSKLYDNVNTCPEKYLLWFHHVSWNHKMQSGRTLWEELNYLYSKGASDCETMSKQWMSLKGKIDDQRHGEVAKRLEEQVRSAKKWRDTCLSYFRPFAEGKALEPAFIK